MVRREGSYIQRISPFFELTLDQEEIEIGWSAQKVSNMIHMLQVIRTLVSPSNTTQVASSCQVTIQQCGLLKKLCETLMASGIPADILTETINALSETIRGHADNQTLFSQVSAPGTPPRSALILLLMAMVNEKQPFALRCAVLYCFQCYLHKNSAGQSDVMQTLLLNADSSEDQVTSGQLLCGGLFSNDKLSNWFSAVAVAHGLMDQDQIKLDLLRVQLSTANSNVPVSLMQQCMAIVTQSSQVQTRLGLLMLLCTWATNCSPAVAQLLSDPTVIQYLTGQIGSNEHDEMERLTQGLCAFLLGLCVTGNDNSVQGASQEQLLQLIEKRIGTEMFLDKLGEVSKHEGYNKALKQPQLKCQDAAELVFDHKFCQNFKVLEHGVMNVVNATQSQKNEECNPQVLQQYKDFIREQDVRITEISRANVYLQQELQNAKAKMEEMTQQIASLQDQNQLLKAQTATDLRSGFLIYVGFTVDFLPLFFLFDYSPELTLRDAKIQQLEAQLASRVNGSHPEPVPVDSQELENVQKQLSSLQVSLSNKDVELEASGKKYLELQESLAALKDEQEDLLIMLSDQDGKVKKYRKKCKELGFVFEGSSEEDEDSD